MDMTFQAEIAKIKEADLIIGIPSYNSAKTIGHLVRAGAAGLAKYFPSVHAVIVNSDGGSTDGTREEAKRVQYSPSRLLSQFFYWVIVLVTLVLGMNALNVPATHDLVTKFFNYLPYLFAAILILVVGYLIATFLWQATLVASVNAQLNSAKLFSRAVRWLIVVRDLTMALYHLGIAEKVILIAFTIILGGIVLGLAIAFGWGGRDLAKDSLERFYQRKRGEEEEPDKDRISHI